MAKGRYQAEIETVSAGVVSTVVCRRFKTAERARRFVERTLAGHAVVATRYTYHRDFANAATGRVADLKLDPSGRILASAAYASGSDWDVAPVDIVPSVGELGYW